MKAMSAQVDISNKQNVHLGKNEFGGGGSDSCPRLQSSHVQWWDSHWGPPWAELVQLRSGVFKVIELHRI